VEEKNSAKKVADDAGNGETIQSSVTDGAPQATLAGVIEDQTRAPADVGLIHPEATLQTRVLKVQTEVSAFLIQEYCRQ
jgi:hypothetical protein